MEKLVLPELVLAVTFVACESRLLSASLPC